MNVELLGINQWSADDDSFNQQTSANNPLPWLQDTQSANVWSLWNANYRDVMILDSSNRFVGALNLTSHDLSVPGNRDLLKQMLRAAANAGDSDRDKLPDHWEYLNFASLAARPDEDADADGHNNLLELAFATNPKDPQSIPRLDLTFSGAKQFRVAFDRWSGSAVDYLAEMSTNLVQWTSASQSIRGTPTNYFDGTGRTRVSYGMTRTITVQPSAAVRINVRPKAAP